MKKGILLLLLAGSVGAQARTLKEALYSGKLKVGTGTVIRKGDDINAKIDSAQKAAALDTTKMAVTGTVDSVVNVTTTDTVRNAATATSNPSIATTDSTTQTETETTAAAPVKTNNAIWKTYMDNVASALKADVLPSKKIKRGSYYVLVSYTIDTTGETTVGDVFVSPENSYLQQQIKDKLVIESPRLSPVLSGAGTPRKVIKKANFTLVKE